MSDLHDDNIENITTEENSDNINNDIAENIEDNNEDVTTEDNNENYIYGEYYYNRHYIRIDDSSNVIEGWSNGPHNNRTPTEDDILINDKGGYQFRLLINGELSEENPALFDGMSMIPLYKWNGSEVVRRDKEEIDFDNEILREKQNKQARIAELHKLLKDTDYIAAKIAEGAATKEEYADKIAQRQAWRDEINELEGKE